MVYKMHWQKSFKNLAYILEILRIKKNSSHYSNDS